MERRGSRKQLLLILQDGCLTCSVTEQPQGWWPLSQKWGMASRASLGPPFSFSVSQPSLLPAWCLGTVMCNLYFNCSPPLCCRPVDTMVRPADLDRGVSVATLKFNWLVWGCPEVWSISWTLHSLLSLYAGSIQPAMPRNPSALAGG